MIRTSSLSLLLFFTILKSHAQSPEKAIQSIDAKCADIRNSIHQMDSTEIDIEGNSPDVGAAVGYYDSTGMRLVIETIYWETGQVETSNYFQNDSVIFVLDRKFIYNRPHYWDEKTARENNDTTVFDLSKSIITENRYYFQHDRSLAWIGEDENFKNLGELENSTIALTYMQEAYDIKSRVENILIIDPQKIDSAVIYPLARVSMEEYHRQSGRHRLGIKETSLLLKYLKNPKSFHGGTPMMFAWSAEIVFYMGDRTNTIRIAPDSDKLLPTDFTISYDAVQQEPSTGAAYFPFVNSEFSAYLGRLVSRVE